jgi:acetylglutamate kinase
VTATVESTTPKRQVAAVLSGLNRLRRWRGRTVVVAWAGSALARIDRRASLARDLVRLHAAGVQLVVVPGGGPRSSSRLVERIEQLGGCAIDVGAGAGLDCTGALDARRVIPVVAAASTSEVGRAVALALLAGERVAGEVVRATFAEKSDQ